jgi:hypothetical protein
MYEKCKLWFICLSNQLHSCTRYFTGVDEDRWTVAGSCSLHTPGWSGRIPRCRRSSWLDRGKGILMKCCRSIARKVNVILKKERFKMTTGQNTWKNVFTCHFVIFFYLCVCTRPLFLIFHVRVYCCSTYEGDGKYIQNSGWKSVQDTPSYGREVVININLKEYRVRKTTDRLLPYRSTVHNL